MTTTKFTTWTKEQRSEYNKQYYEDNKDHLKERYKENSRQYRKRKLEQASLKNMI